MGSGMATISMCGRPSGVFYPRDRQVLRPHHGAPHGGPSPWQLVADLPSVTRPGAGRPMSWSRSSLSHFGQVTAVAVRPETRASKAWWHLRQVYSYSGIDRSVSLPAFLVEFAGAEEDFAFF